MITRPKGESSWAKSLLALALAITPIQAQSQTQPQSPFAALISYYLTRDAGGHSPTPEDIASMATLTPTPDAPAVREALPLLLKALANPDIPLHTFALTALTGLQTPASVTPAQPAPLPGAVIPLSYKLEIARQLAAGVPQIATHLTEESQADRLLTATVLGGFTPDPPATVFPPLIAFLKRDDAISPVGFAVVTDLLQLGPISDDSAAAITRYLRRADQTSETRANLVDLIASNPRHSQAVDKAILAYLNADENSLRARVILSLPQLDLAQDVFADTQSRIAVLSSNPNENLQVVTAAKAIVTCWVAPKMATGCPVY